MFQVRQAHSYLLQEPFGNACAGSAGLDRASYLHIQLDVTLEFIECWDEQKEREEKHT